ncbi:MAG: zinc-ribbon domain-containing protein [Acidobacteria bacterium]|nr:zinc-ribbon domain-containing protein [Acidobacteriota bacterium]
MVVTCPSCASRFQYDESRFKDLHSKRFRCPKCSHVFEVSNPTLPIDLSTLLRPGATSQHKLGQVPVAEEFVPPPAPPTGANPFPADLPPLPPPEPADHTGDTTAKRNRAALLGEAGIGSLPQGFRFSVAFLSGPHASTVKVIDQARVLIGREEGDIVTMDPESSRRHAVIEIQTDGSAWITDLNSTNGVYVDGALITERTRLHDRTEFMCGRSTFMMMIREDDPFGLG